MKQKKKFEKLVEYILNEDQDKFDSLFHDIVVERSREIYNQLVTEAEDDEVGDFVSDIESDEEGLDDMSIDDAADDLDDELDGDTVSGEEEADTEELEDRIVDLETELDNLKAEFEALMSDDEGEGDFDMDSEEGMGDEGEGDEMDFDLDDEIDFGDMDDDEDEVEESEYDEFAESEDEDLDEDEDSLREYTEKRSPNHGDNGAYTKSAVAGKNDMGGSAKNLNQTADEKGMTPAKAKDMNTGNRNVPGGKSGMEKGPSHGHGSEKKGAGDQAPDKKSLLGSRK